MEKCILFSEYNGGEGVSYVCEVKVDDLTAHLKPIGNHLDMSG